MSWVDLLDDLAGRRVLLADGGRGRAAAGLAARVGDSGKVVAAEHAKVGDQWDLIAIEGDVETELRTRRDALAPGGRLVVITDNRLSPLRMLDIARRARAGAAGAATLASLKRRLRAAGLVPRQSFGLLRSSVAPVTAFDLDSPRAARAVLAASATHVAGLRGRGLRVLHHAVGRGAAGALVPAWLVLATADGDPYEPDPLRLTGRIALEQSSVVKLLRGERHQVVEKVYSNVVAADSEVMALTLLAGAGIGEVASIVARPAADRIAISWIDGRTLDLKRLPEPELEAWTERAARVLARIQAATRRPDGRVLVHGDYWLGNVVVDGDHIVGVIDWGRARLGDEATDREFLAASLEGFRATSPELLRRLAAAVDRGIR